MMKETIQLILHLVIIAIWIAFVILIIRTYRQHKKELKLINKFYDDWAKNVHEPFFKWWRQVANFPVTDYQSYVDAWDIPALLCDKIRLKLGLGWEYYSENKIEVTLDNILDDSDKRLINSIYPFNLN